MSEMTVEELIWELTKLPGDTRVFVPGCCGDGLDDKVSVKSTMVALDCDNFHGSHEYHDPDDSYDVQVHAGRTIVSGVVIQ